MAVESDTIRKLLCYAVDLGASDAEAQNAAHRFIAAVRRNRLGIESLATILDSGSPANSNGRGSSPTTEQRTIARLEAELAEARTRCQGLEARLARAAEKARTNSENSRNELREYVERVGAPALTRSAAAFMALETICGVKSAKTVMGEFMSFLNEDRALGQEFKAAYSRYYGDDSAMKAKADFQALHAKYWCPRDAEVGEGFNTGYDGLVAKYAGARLAGEALAEYAALYAKSDALKARLRGLKTKLKLWADARSPSAEKT